MALDLRRRIELLEEQFPTATATADGAVGEIAFAKATAFVDAHGGRQENESWAAAMARILGITQSGLRAWLSDNRASRYLSEGRP
jgi:hypothetical protein